jgi:putative ABC transport system permease protein
MEVSAVPVGSFQYLEPLSARAFNLTGSDEPRRVTARRVTPDGHRLLGEGVALGRDFQPGDDQPGRNQVVLLCNRLWRQRYGADPGIIGRDIHLDGRPYTVVGVLPAGSSDRLPADLWIPLTFEPDQVTHAARTLIVKGRLKPGVSIEQAQHEMTSIAGELARRVSQSNTGWSASVEPMQNNFLSADRRRYGSCWWRWDSWWPTCSSREVRRASVRWRSAHRWGRVGSA